MNRALLLLVLSLVASPTLPAQDFSTYTYYDSLQLDYFAPTPGGAASSAAGRPPLLLYVHGGGFSGGHRREGYDLCGFLQTQGVACATMSYTLSMRGRTQDWSCDGVLSEKLRTLQLAASEAWAATAYLVAHADSLGFDPDQIILTGSSAGAEAILAAAFYDRPTLSLTDHGLADDFRYAGAVSGAGALISPHLITAENAIPLLLLHGTDDPLVPYGTAPHHYCQPNDSGWLLLAGAGALVERLEEVGDSYHLITHVGGGHGIAGYYFHGGAERMGVVADFVGRLGRGYRFSVRELR